MNEIEVKRELIKEVHSYNPYFNTWKIIKYYDVVTEEPLEAIGNNQKAMKKE